MTLAFGPLPAVGRRPYTADVQAILDQFADDVNLEFASLPVVSGAPLIANQMADVGWDYAAVLSNIGVFSTVQSDARYALNAQQIIAGTGLTGGGTLAADRTLSLANTAVTPGTYGDATHSLTATVNQQGQITALTAVAISGGGGGAVTSVNTRTGAVVGLAEAATTITAGTGLSGGGDLSANRTLSLPNVGTAATTGDASHVGQFTTDAQGRVSAATAVAIALAGTAITSGTVAAARLPTLDAIGVPVANVSLNSQRITNLADPVGAQDVATKHYVDTAGPVLSVNTRTGVVTGLAEASQIAGLLGNTGGWTLGTNTDIYLPSSSWSAGVLTGGLVKQATALHLTQTFTQTAQAADTLTGTPLIVELNATLNNTLPSVGVGLYGPRGTINLEGISRLGADQGTFAFMPLGVFDMMRHTNTVGANRVLTPGWGFGNARTVYADTNTVTLHGNDIASGTAAFVDAQTFMTAHSGTLNGTTNSYEIISYLSMPFTMGNSHISRRTAFKVNDLNQYLGSPGTDLSGNLGASFIPGADAGVGTVDEQYGIIIGPLTQAVNVNVGMLSHASVWIDDGTDAHGATQINAGLAFTIPIAGISIFKNASELRAGQSPVAELLSDGGIGRLAFGAGASSAPDFVIARTGTAAAAVTGTLTLPSPIFTSPVVSDGSFSITNSGSTSSLTITDGTAGHGAILIGNGAFGPGLNLDVTAGDTKHAVTIGVTGISIGPGGSTNSDFKFLRTGTAAGAITGTVTMTSPVISGHAVIEGVTPTGATGTGKLVFDTAPTLGATTVGTLAATDTITITDAKDIVLASTTGTQIGTATSQKLGFLGATPVIQQANSVDLGSVLTNFGFRASGGNPPLNLGTGALTAGTSALSGAMTFSGATITMTSTGANQTGSIKFDVNNFSTADLTAITIYKAAADTKGTITLTDLNGTPTIALGPGGTTATDVQLQRTGTAAASFTGTITLPSPVISGHATIEGVTPTGNAGTGKLVFDTSPTLVTPVIGAATGTSLAVTGAITSSGGGIGYATGAGTAVTQLTNKTTAFPTIGSHLCGTLTWNNAALTSDTSVTSASSTATLIAATDIVCFTHISGGTIGAYIMTCTPSAGTWTLTLRNVHSGSLSEAPVFAFAIIKGVTS